MTRPIRFLLLMIGSFFATSAILFALHAHADGAATPAQTAAATGISWGFWLGLAGTVLGAISNVLHYLGRRWKSAETIAEDADKVRNVLPGQNGRISQSMLMGLALTGLGVAALVGWCAGCGPIKGAAGDAPKLLADCAKAEVATLAGQLLPDVEAILVGESPHWDVTLGRLEAGAGDAAVCAVKDAAADFEARLKPDPGAPKVEGQEAIGLGRARGFLRARGEL